MPGELDVLRRGLAEAAHVVGDDAIAGIDEARHDAVPGAPVHDRRVHQQDRAARRGRRGLRRPAGRRGRRSRFRSLVIGTMLGQRAMRGPDGRPSRRPVRAGRLSRRPVARRRRRRPCPDRIDRLDLPVGRHAGHERQAPGQRAAPSVVMTLPIWRSTERASSRGSAPHAVVAGARSAAARSNAHHAIQPGCFVRSSQSSIAARRLLCRPPGTAPLGRCSGGR